jgi:hypothetical protein
VCLDRGAHACAAGADHEYVVLRVHLGRTLPNRSLAPRAEPRRRCGAVAHATAPAAQIPSVTQNVFPTQVFPAPVLRSPPSKKWFRHPVLPEIRLCSDVPNA